MTRTDDFIGQLEGYLDEYEGSTPLPEDVRDAIRAELPSTHQRPTWWPARRFPEMNNMMKLGLAAAGVVVAALLGYNYLLAPNVGGPAIDDPSPTPVPTATPPPASGGLLDAGTYTLVDHDRRITVTLPDGWTGNGWYVDKGDGLNHAGLMLFAGVDFVFADPCQWRDGFMPSIGPSVEDLATALANQPQRGESVPSEVSIDGYSGQLIELTVPSDIDFADCDSDGGQFYSFPGRFHQGPDQHDEFYIIDVDGSRVVIDAPYFPGTPPEVRDELRQIIDSIQIEP